MSRPLPLPTPLDAELRALHQQHADAVAAGDLVRAGLLRSLVFNLEQALRESGFRVPELEVPAAPAPGTDAVRRFDERHPRLGDVVFPLGLTARRITDLTATHAYAGADAVALASLTYNGGDTWRERPPR